MERAEPERCSGELSAMLASVAEAPFRLMLAAGYREGIQEGERRLLGSCVASLGLATYLDRKVIPLITAEPLPQDRFPRPVFARHRVQCLVPAAFCGALFALLRIMVQAYSMRMQSIEDVFRRATTAFPLELEPSLRPKCNPRNPRSSLQVT